MPYEVVTSSVQAALRALLVADATLVGRLAVRPTPRGGGPAIYDDGDVPSGATFPYLTIGAWTQTKFHTMAPDGSAGYGWNCTGQIKAIGQLSGGKNEATLANVMSAVFAALPHGLGITVAGYSKSWVDEATLQPAIKTTLNSVVTIEVPAIFRVYAT